MKQLLTAVLIAALLLPASACASIVGPEGIDTDFLSFSGICAYPAIVLCESLTVCDAPNGSSVHTLAYGRTFLTYETDGAWINCYYSDGVETGWVRADYVLVDPACYITDAATPVYAYANQSAPRVALLPAGECLPIIHDEGDWLVVSLRGAAGCIRKNAADAQQFITDASPLLPDQHEISQDEAYILAKAHLIQNNLANVQTLAALQHDFAYYGSAQVGWCVLWRDDAGRIIWQVSLEKHTGTILEAFHVSNGLG